MTPVLLPADTLKLCHRCGRRLPPGAFRGARVVRCRPCEAGPPDEFLAREQVATATPMMPDEPPTPAIFTEHAIALRCLRAGLEEARREGLGFDTVWDPVVREALFNVPVEERLAWRSVLEETRPAWESAYGDAAHQRAA